MMIRCQVELAVMEPGGSGGKHRTLSKQAGAAINILGGNIHYVSQVKTPLSPSPFGLFEGGLVVGTMVGGPKEC